MALLVLSLLTGGCTATYVPISWGMKDKVQYLSRNDLILSILYERYDPKRETLAFAGSSFNQVMMPGEVKRHLGAYRHDKKLIYRNLYQEYTDQQLRDLLLHELAHHIWHGYMSTQQKMDWAAHLDDNPSPFRDMVRRVYEKPADHPNEDFAFTVEYAREVDIEELARIKLVTEEERDRILKAMKTAKHPEIAPENEAASALGDKPSKNESSASGDKPSKAEPVVSASGDQGPKGEPSVSKTEPSVSKTEPSVSKTEPSVSKTEPSVSKTEPSVSAPQDKLSNIEPAPSDSGEKLPNAEPSVSVSRDKLSKAEPYVAVSGGKLFKAEPSTTH